MKRVAVAAAALLLGVAQDALPQGMGSAGAVSGTVADPSGATIAGASVQLQSIFHTERPRYRAQFTVVNLTNKDALYNFLSTFSGTHFVSPRAYTAEIGMVW